MVDCRFLRFLRPCMSPGADLYSGMHGSPVTLCGFESLAGRAMRGCWKDPMKRSSWKKTPFKAVAVIATGTMFQLGNTGCISFFTNAGLSSMDFCFLLNCNDGALGGLIDFCAPINFTSFVGTGPGGADQVDVTPFLADCPQQ